MAHTGQPAPLRHSFYGIGGSRIHVAVHSVEVDRPSLDFKGRGAKSDGPFIKKVRRSVDKNAATNFASGQTKFVYRLSTVLPDSSEFFDHPTDFLVAATE